MYIDNHHLQQGDQVKRMIQIKQREIYFAKNESPQKAQKYHMIT